jgi:REP element-mobilizing transposase RayT
MGDSPAEDRSSSNESRPKESPEAILVRRGAPGMRMLGAAFCGYQRWRSGLPDSLMHRLYAHIVWTTLQRLPLITADRARVLDRYLRISARHHDARVLAVGMVTTHVHLLIQFAPSTALVKLVQALKGGSATVINREVPTQPPLRWARGYSMHTLGERHLAAVRAYVARQPENHPLERIVGWMDGPCSREE